MLKLENLIGSGNERHCYQHPIDNDKCIKITFSQKKTRINESNVEYEYCQRLIKSDSNIHSAPISLSYGWVNTDKGDGLVCDLIRDYDGHISKTLAYYRKECQLKENDITQGLTDLLQGLIKHSIAITYVHDRNILVQYVTKDKYHFILIDGLGSSNAIPLAYWIKHYARKQTTRRFLKCYKNIKL